MTLFAFETGGGPSTIVLLHGFGGSHRDWDRVWPRLDARVIAYDLPGHAASLAGADAAAPRRAAAAVLADLAERGEDPVHLAGHSMGGAIATLMALEAPARIASLTLLAPGGFGPEINARLLRRSAVARDAPAMRACLEAMYGWSSDVPEEAVEAAVAMRRAPGQAEALARLAERITPDGRQGAIPREALAGLEMPVAIVWGDVDNVLPPFHATSLPPAFALHRVAGIGHMLPREAPELVAGIIMRACPPRR